MAELYNRYYEPKIHDSSPYANCNINIADLMPVDVFKSKVDEWVRTIKNGKLQKGFDEILLPGERAWRERQKRLKDGIPVQPGYWQGIKNMAAEAGVDIEALRT